MRNGARAFSGCVPLGAGPPALLVPLRAHTAASCCSERGRRSGGAADAARRQTLPPLARVLVPRPRPVPLPLSAVTRARRKQTPPALIKQCLSP